MTEQNNVYPFIPGVEGADFPRMARDLAFERAIDLGILDEYPNFNPGNVYVLSYFFVLGNCKAIVSTSLPDGRFYEITYAADVQKAFVDTYQRQEGVVIDINFRVESEDPPA